MGFFDFLSNKAKSNETQSVKKIVDNCLNLESSGNISSLQNSLYQLYSLMNKPGGGKIVLDYKEKDNLALCFVFMLRYDWINDSDIREVWAENGFYCILDNLENQKHGMQGQAEGMIILFSLLCVGRNDLKRKINSILSKAQAVQNPVFHTDDYVLGAQNVIDQFSLLAVSGIRALGQKAIPVMNKIVQKFNGGAYFEQTIKRRDLMKYDVMDVFTKAKFIKSIIESILQDV